MDINVLYYGDNLAILRNYVADESIDLIYIDPPFNSNQAYNVIFSEPNGTSSQAQIQAFDDTWHWIEAKRTYSEIIENAPTKIVECISSFRNFLGTTDMMAYLTMMTPRLIELHRVLKPTGSLYLHCDPTASHYLKIVLDQVFGIKNFRNEIIWWYYNKMPTGGNILGCSHDVILHYSKTRNFTANLVKEPRLSTDRTRKRKKINGKSVILEYVENTTEKKISDVWQIPLIGSTAKERLGYATQKPERLLERIIEASSNEGDVVLDAFAGCGTTIAVAQSLKRCWIGIDITHIAIAVIKNRLQNTFGDNVKYKVIGEPQDTASARALAEQDRYQFQWWALSLIKARPVQEKRKGADAGVDGVIYLQDVNPDEPQKPVTLKIIVQVKSGKVSVKDIRDLRGVIEREKAIIGVFITLEDATQPMVVEAIEADDYERWGQKYPKIQILTIEELFQGKKIASPQTPTKLFFSFGKRKEKFDQKKRKILNTGFKRAEKVENSKEMQQELDL